MPIDIGVAATLTVAYFLMVLNNNVFEKYRSFVKFDIVGVLAVMSWIFCTLDDISYIIAGIISVVVGIFFSFVTVKTTKEIKREEKKEEDVPAKEADFTDPYIGKKGKIKLIVNPKNYIGVLEDGSDILVYSEVVLKVGDEFKVTEIDDGKIVCVDA